jgi:hypothetical protein
MALLSWRSNIGQQIFMGCSFAHEGRASYFEAQNLARHMISFGVGRHPWLDIPYSNSIHVNIIAD